jgi:hypothetical protein
MRKMVGAHACQDAVITTRLVMPSDETAVLGCAVLSLSASSSPWLSNSTVSVLRGRRKSCFFAPSRFPASICLRLLPGTQQRCWLAGEDRHFLHTADGVLFLGRPFLLSVFRGRRKPYYFAPRASVFTHSSRRVLVMSARAFFASGESDSSVLLFALISSSSAGRPFIRLFIADIRSICALASCLPPPL